ncbi:MAG: hypothetical protein K6T17_06705 [Fimbriimonadales bacterium]|nr:hypothetical protein [Fimbriimonadales bacterium]
MNSPTQPTLEERLERLEHSYRRVLFLLGITSGILISLGIGAFSSSPQRGVMDVRLVDVSYLSRPLDVHIKSTSPTAFNPVTPVDVRITGQPIRVQTR